MAKSLERQPKVIISLEPLRLITFRLGQSNPKIILLCDKNGTVNAT